MILVNMTGFDSWDKMCNQAATQASMCWSSSHLIMLVFPQSGTPCTVNLHSLFNAVTMDTLTERLEHTRLNDEPKAEQLLFMPQADSGLAATALYNIPRYLFRVVTPRSDGKMDETWVRSQSASQNKASSVEDISTIWISRKERSWL